MTSGLMVGFIVNVFNPLNYDIHIYDMNNFNASNEYTYMDEDNVLKKAKTHRCRLSGILRKKNPSPLEHDEYMQAFRNLNMHINKLNGWVLVKVQGVDKFKRLLVELFDVITGKSINDELKKNSNIFIQYTIDN